MGHAINHCGLTRAIGQAGLTRHDFQEEVMNRAAELITAAQTGQNGPKPHKLAGVELVAQSVATHVIDEGARQVACDMNVDLRQLKELAASQHISSC